MQQLVRYGLVGLVSAALNYSLFIGAIRLGVYYLAAATLSSVITLIVGYFLNRSFTFAVAGAANATEFASFLGVFAVQYAMAMTGYALLIGQLELGPTAAFVLNNIVIVPVTFTLLQNFTFKRRNAK